MRRIVIGMFSAIVLLILFVVLFTFVRRPYEDILLNRFGTLIPQNKQSRIMYNWFFKWPTDSIVRIDRRLHLTTLPLQEFVTKGAEPVNVRTFVVWRITDATAFTNKANGSDERAQEIIKTSVLSLLGSEMGSHKLDEFFNTDPNTEQHTRDLEKRIATNATNGFDDGKTKRVTGLNDIGVEIADIGFSRMAFPPDNTNSVYQRMVAALNEKARGYESSGLKEADVIRAEGQRKAAEIVAEAKAKAEEIRGEGDNEALKILQAVNNTPAAREFYQEWKKLDFLKAYLTKNTYLILSTDDPFVSPLFKGPQGAGGGSLPFPTPVAPASGALQSGDRSILPVPPAARQ